jgi:hypothetical protein
MDYISRDGTKSSLLDDIDYKGDCEMDSRMKTLIGLLMLTWAAGCTSSIGFGDDEDGVGVRGTVAKDGKIVDVETTDGAGRGQIE